MKLKEKMLPQPQPQLYNEDEEEEEEEDDDEENEESEEEVEDDLEPEADIEMEPDPEPEAIEVSLSSGLGDDTELIDLIIDQNDTPQRTYTDINVTALTLKNYNTYPYLTKYEKARVLGLRAEQLGRNAPILINSVQVQGLSDHEIAWQEVLAGRCPWIIARPLPNGTRLLISVNLLKIL